MNDSLFDRFNARLQGQDNRAANSRALSADPELDTLMLRLSAVHALGDSYAHVQLSSYTKARMGIAPAAEYTEEVFAHELEAVSV